MQKYFDWNGEKVITEEEIKENYDEFANKEEYETFEKYLECCQDYNDGSLTKLDVYIQRLENRLNKYSKYPGNDNTEIILEIEQLKKEL